MLYIFQMKLISNKTILVEWKTNCDFFDIELLLQPVVFDFESNGRYFSYRSFQNFLFSGSNHLARVSQAMTHVRGPTNESARTNFAGKAEGPSQRIIKTQPCSQNRSKLNTKMSQSKPADLEADKINLGALKNQ